MKKKIALMFGGPSPENEISVISAMQIIENYDTEKYEMIPCYVSRYGDMYGGDNFASISAYSDIEKLLERNPPVRLEKRGGEVFLIEEARGFFQKEKVTKIEAAYMAFHGVVGESGGYQGFCEVLGLPYTGSNVAGASVGFDKVIMKQLCERFAIPVAAYVWFYADKFILDQDAVVKTVEENLSYPMFVKPASGGSSIGIEKVKDQASLKRAIEVATKFDSKVIVEESFEDANEYNISVLGDHGGDIQTSVIEQVFSKSEVLDFENKYMSGGSKGGVKNQSAGMASVSRKIPAELSSELSEKISKAAAEAFMILNASGVSRCDFLLRPKTGEFIFIEINTFPGSASYYLWEATGVSFKDLNSRLLDIAFTRHSEKKNPNMFKTEILKNFEKNTGAKGSKI